MTFQPKRITVRTVSALKPGQLVWDTVVRGFGVRCQRRDKVYVLKTQIGGKSRWFSIGKHGSPWTPEQARTRAKAILGDAANGKDPAMLREMDRNKPTIDDLCKRYLSDYAAEYKKPSSIEADQRNIRNHIGPLLGKRFVAEISRTDVDMLVRSVKDGKTAKVRPGDQIGGAAVTGGAVVANRCLALTSKMLNLAERWGWRPEGTNPCRHVDRYREKGRERFLSEKELATLADVLRDVDAKRAEADALRVKLQEDGGVSITAKYNLRGLESESESPFVIAAVRLLIFTGARLSEILTLQWNHIDFEGAMLMLPDSKTGQKVVYLSAPALQTLADIPRIEGNPYVICGDKDGAHLVNLQKPWQRIRKRAAIEDVRLHDLRHSCASVAVSGGLSLPMIGKLLGHTQAVTTERYAHFAADPLRAANEVIGARIRAVMERASGEVLSVEARRK